MGTAENRQLVVDVYRLMNARRFDEMWALFTPDATWGGGGNPPALLAPVDQMRQIIVDPMPVFVGGGIHFTLHAMTAEGDRVAAEVESYAELVSGPVYNNKYHMLFEMADGRIRGVKEYGDTLHAKEVFVDSGVMSRERMTLGSDGGGG